MFETAKVKCIENIVEKRRNCSLGAISPLFYNILLPDVRFPCFIGTRFSFRDKRLFEISEVEITRVDCIVTHVRNDMKRMPEICMHIHIAKRQKCRYQGK